MKIMNNAPNNKGITLIALVITIIVMLILATVTINVSSNSIEHSKVIKFVAYMQAIQKKVDLIAEYEDYTKYGESLTDKQTQQLEEILETTISDNSQYKAFNTNKISKDFELDDIDDEIVVNFETREVISLIGVKYEGKMYYTQYELPGGQTLSTYKETERNITISVEDITTKVDGLNATFTIKNISENNCTLYYGIVKQDDEESEKINWKIITNKTKKGKEITTQNISQSGKYVFKLEDNITKKTASTEEIELKLTNKPTAQTGLDKDTLSEYNYSSLDSSLWAYITADDGSTEYVWVPRFAYDSENNIEFLRGTTDITTSGGYRDSNWTIPTKFTKDGQDLTGVWVKVGSYSEEDLNIITVLNTGEIL